MKMMNNEEREANISARCMAMEKRILDAIDDEEDITIALTVMVELVHSIVMSYSNHNKIHLAVLEGLETLYEMDKENDKT
jgi:hypothetical protein